MDMELRLTRPDTRQTQVTVTCDDAFSHTFDLHTLIPSKTNGPPHPMIDPVTYGKLLYAALFPQGSLAYQALVAKPSRILLVTADDLLDALPWEMPLAPAAMSRVAARLCAAYHRSSASCISWATADRMKRARLCCVLSGTMAREFVQRVQGGVFLVTLNACESATPGETVFGNLAKALVREQVPYALGMRFFVHDDDALAFSRDFYSNLARGIPVEDALVQARLTLAKSERAWAVGNLVLYTSLTHAAPGYMTESGVPAVLDAQENALRGIIGVLPEVQGAFQGRIDEQIQLGKWLTGDRRPPIMTIHGNGGQGKTALARIAAERFAHAWPGGVWSIIMETVPTRTVFAASLARFLGIDPQQAELESQIQLRLRRRRTLLVLDNLETLDEAAKAQNAEALALIALIQQLPGERTSLLCTSRHLLGWSGEQHLELPGLAADEGAALFQQSAPHRTEEIELSLAQQ